MKLIQNNVYTFIVDVKSTKTEIAKAVEDMFKVKVLGVRTMTSTSIKKQQRTRRGYFDSTPVKKAMVSLKKGDKIALFEASTPQEEHVHVETAEGEKITTVKEKKSLLKGTKVKIEKEGN
jgi:large subunit ribosomal protein L23